MPLVVVLVSLLVGVGHTAGADSAPSRSSATNTPFHYVDRSGLVSESFAARWGETTSTTSPGTARTSSPDGSTRGRVPASPRLVHPGHRDLPGDCSSNGGVLVPAQRVLEQSVAAGVDDHESVSSCAHLPTTDVTAYADGRVAPGWLSIVPPLLYVAAFFGLVILLAARMVTVVVEEKENRISEMILTTVTAGDLIRGKVVAMLLVCLVQIGVFLVPWGCAACGGAPAIRRSGRARDDRPVADAGRSPAARRWGAAGLGAVRRRRCSGPLDKGASALPSTAIFALVIPVYAAFFVMTSPRAPSPRSSRTSDVHPDHRDGPERRGGAVPAESVVCIVEVFAVGGVLLWFAQYLFRHSVAQYGSKVTVRQVLSWRRKRS